MNTNKVIYWLSTAVIVLVMGFGSFADLFMVDAVRETITQLGFPVYFLPFFGLAKLLATVVIVTPALHYFKLSAYVGLFWYFLGAVYAHVAVGDPFVLMIGALVSLAAVVASYLSWRKLEEEPHLASTAALVR